MTPSERALLLAVARHAEELTLKGMDRAKWGCSITPLIAAVEVEAAPNRDQLEGLVCDLVARFSDALLSKLIASERKYGWANGWAKDDWRETCVKELMRHVEKGDPLDVAAYCAFMWHHGWATASNTEARPKNWDAETERALMREWAAACEDTGKEFAGLDDIFPDNHPDHFLRELAAMAPAVEAESAPKPVTDPLGSIFDGLEDMPEPIDKMPTHDEMLAVINDISAAVEAEAKSCETCAYKTRCPRGSVDWDDCPTYGGEYGKD